MNIIHIIALIIGLFAISRAFLRWREAKISLGEMLFWGSLWVCAILFAIFPDILNFFSNRAGLGRGMDLVLALSIIMLLHRMIEEEIL